MMGVSVCTHAQLWCCCACHAPGSVSSGVLTLLLVQALQQHQLTTTAAHAGLPERVNAKDYIYRPYPDSEAVQDLSWGYDHGHVTWLAGEAAGGMEVDLTPEQLVPFGWQPNDFREERVEQGKDLFSHEMWEVEMWVPHHKNRSV